MELNPVFLSRLQFAFVISFHIIFPAFTIGLAAWLATIEGARLATGNALYRRVFDFWLKVFAVRSAWGWSPASSWRSSSAPTGACSPSAPARSRARFSAHVFTAFLLKLLRRHAAGPRVSPGLFLRLLHGVARNDVLLVLDPRQQQLDAGAARPRDRRRQDHPGRLAGDRARAGAAGALAAHAARRLSHHRHVRDRDRRLVHAARRPPGRGARDAALGPGPGRGADPGAAVLRPPDRPLRARAPAGEVRRDRGALADAAAGQRGADRLARRRRRAQPASRSTSRGSAASSPRATGTARELGLETSRPRTGRRW